MNEHGGSEAEIPPGRNAETAARITPGRLRLAAVSVASLAALVVLSGMVSRGSDKAAVAQWTRQQAIPSVAVIRPSTRGIGGAVVLPGRVEAYYKAPIYARVNGYLKAWYTDIGARVQAGQLLAEIETPDLDQQLAQAKAELATARANEALAAITAQRWQLMVKADSVSRQAADEKSGDLAAKQAIAAAAAANLQKLEALEGFKKIVAPFDGMVTARNTDVGALINAGSGSGQQLFTVSDLRSLRVYVSVPQDDAGAISTGMDATLSVPEHPGASYRATVVGTAGAVEAESGTLLVELTLPGAAGAVLPGDYANVRFELPAVSGMVRIPATALIFKSKGLQVATLNAHERVELRPISIQRDLGTSVEVATGLSAADRVIDAPPEALQEGDEVQVSGAVGPTVSEDPPAGQTADPRPPHAGS